MQQKQHKYLRAPLSSSLNLPIPLKSSKDKKQSSIISSTYPNATTGTGNSTTGSRNTYFPSTSSPVKRPHNLFAKPSFPYDIALLTNFTDRMLSAKIEMYGGNPIEIGWAGSSSAYDEEILNLMAASINKKRLSSVVEEPLLTICTGIATSVSNPSSVILILDAGTAAILRSSFMKLNDKIAQEDKSTLRAIRMVDDRFIHRGVWRRQIQDLDEYILGHLLEDAVPEPKSSTHREVAQRNTMQVDKLPSIVDNSSPKKRPRSFLEELSQSPLSPEQSGNLPKKISRKPKIQLNDLNLSVSGFFTWLSPPDAEEDEKQNNSGKKDDELESKIFEAILKVSQELNFSIPVVIHALIVHNGSFSCAIDYLLHDETHSTTIANHDDDDHDQMWTPYEDAYLRMDPLVCTEKDLAVMKSICEQRGLDGCIRRLLFLGMKELDANERMQKCLECD